MIQIQYSSSNHYSRILLQYRLSMFFPLYFSLLLTIHAQSSAYNYCLYNSNCVYCPKNTCQACVSSFERTEIGTCIPDNTVFYCQLYSRTGTCLECKPNYRSFFVNQCVMNYDGCVISAPDFTCFKCLEGAFLNNFGKCNVRYINCLDVTDNGQCSKCQKYYRLQYGMCKNGQPQCSETNSETGLCLSCKEPYVIHHYICALIQQIFDNCYLMNIEFDSCLYCKNGYELFQGKCYPKNQLIASIYSKSIEPELQCQQNYFYSPVSGSCSPMPQYCQKFDYGHLKCVFCEGSKIQVQGLCRDGSLRFCEIFNSSNNLSCQKCKPRFFVNSKQLCSPYPLFCQTVVGQVCVKCIDQFLLNEDGICEDPNCYRPNTLTYQCRECKTSYKINQTTGICTFNDLACDVKDPNNLSRCLKCKQDYKYSEKESRCKYVDPDCKRFSDKQICIECYPGFYLRALNNVCNKLPENCNLADPYGKCQQCKDGYALLVDHHCGQIKAEQNCQITSKFNQCIKCKDSFYLNINTGTCSSLPPYCRQFNRNLKKCTKCLDSAILENGECKDRYCEIFGPDLQCYGCKKGSMFNRFGQCVPEIRDLNCQEFSHGLCKKCSQFYYFDKNWNCIKVQPECKDYNPNNGKCTSCHGGYEIEKGSCVKSSQKKETCMELNTDGKCKKCTSGNYLFQGKCYDYILGCLQLNPQNKLCSRCSENFQLLNGLCFNDKIKPSIEKEVDINCLQFDEESQMCKKCISRMYYSSKLLKCTQIDLNCNTYEPISGVCITCYSGYVVSQSNSRVCETAKPQDPNCKISDPENPSRCSECYTGYFYSEQNKQCRESDNQCKTSSNSGECLTCWDGYGLKNGQCVYVMNCVKFQSNQCQQCSSGFQLITQQCVPSLVSQTQIKTNPITDVQCLRWTQSTPKRCLECITGTVYDEVELKCLNPYYGEDQWCERYEKRLCVKCKAGMFIYNYKCVEMDKNCVRYNPGLTLCEECQNNLTPRDIKCV